MQCGETSKEQVSTVFNCYVKIKDTYQYVFYAQIALTVFIALCLFIKLRWFTHDHQEEIEILMKKKAHEAQKIEIQQRAYNKGRYTQQLTFGGFTDTSFQNHIPTSSNHLDSSMDNNNNHTNMRFTGVGRENTLASDPMSNTIT